MSKWEMETYFGGAKYYEQLEPNPSPTPLIDELNGPYDPFALDAETGKQMTPWAQDAWYQGNPTVNQGKISRPRRQIKDVR